MENGCFCDISAWFSGASSRCYGSPGPLPSTAPKYVTKSEPRSQSLKEIFTTIIRGLREGNTSLKAVQKLLINTVGERNYSAQETCHLHLQLPMFKASRDFIILSLDGSCAVEDHLGEGQHATALSIIDHYMGHRDSPHFNSMTLPASTPCPRPSELSQPAEADVLLLSHDRMSPQILLARSMAASVLSPVTDVAQVFPPVG